jgi:hypothetical protein
MEGDHEDPARFAGIHEPTGGAGSRSSNFYEYPIAGLQGRPMEVQIQATKLRPVMALSMTSRFADSSLN